MAESAQRRSVLVAGEAGGELGGEVGERGAGVVSDPVDDLAVDGAGGGVGVDGVGGAGGDEFADGVHDHRLLPAGSFSFGVA